MANETAAAEMDSNAAATPVSQVANDLAAAGNGVTPEPAKPAQPSNPQASSPIGNAAEPAPLPTLRSPQQLRVGARLQTWQPRDGFDPEIFNRMQRARTRLPAAIQPATAETVR